MSTKSRKGRVERGSSWASVKAAVPPPAPDRKDSQHYLQSYKKPVGPPKAKYFPNRFFGADEKIEATPNHFGYNAVTDRDDEKHWARDSYWDSKARTAHVQDGKGEVVAVGDSALVQGHLKIDLYATDIVQRDLFDPSDPFLVLSVVHGPHVQKVYRTEVCMNTKYPNWKPFIVDVIKLCAGNQDATLQFEVFDYDASFSTEAIGGCRTTIRKLLQGKRQYNLVSSDATQDNRSKRKATGVLVFDRVTLLPVDSLEAMQVNQLNAWPETGSYAVKAGKYDRAYSFVSGGEAFNRNVDTYGRKTSEKNPAFKEKEWHPFVVEGDPTGRDFRAGDPVGVTLFGTGVKYGIQATTHFLLEKAEREHQRATDRNRVADLMVQWLDGTPVRFPWTGKDEYYRPKHGRAVEEFDPKRIDWRGQRAIEYESERRRLGAHTRGWMGGKHVGDDSDSDSDRGTPVYDTRSGRPSRSSRVASASREEDVAYKRFEAARKRESVRTRSGIVDSDSDDSGGGGARRTPSGRARTVTRNSNNYDEFVSNKNNPDRARTPTRDRDPDRDRDRGRDRDDSTDSRDKRDRGRDTRDRRRSPSPPKRGRVENPRRDPSAGRSGRDRDPAVSRSGRDRDAGRGDRDGRGSPRRGDRDGRDRDGRGSPRRGDRDGRGSPRRGDRDGRGSPRRGDRDGRDRGGRESRGDKDDGRRGRSSGRGESADERAAKARGGTYVRV